MTDMTAAAETGHSQTAPKIEVRRRGALVNFVLNRPKRLNALDDSMRKTLADEIPRIARNPDIYIVALTSSGARAFCAGGDVRALVAAAATDKALARAMFAAEYKLDWLLDCFSKPTISLIDGMCMGSGAGLTCFNTHRVAAENYAFAMPETAIGLFPDVGVSHLLARMPWPVGLYLGLTGRSISRADAYWLGLATHCIGAAHFEPILAALAEAEPVDAMLDALHEEPGKGPVQAEMAMIRDTFSEASIGAICAKLSKASGASKHWAETTLADLCKRSPMSLAITDRHIRACRTLDLRETLIQDYRLAWRCLEAPDFKEGVRAALIDKDNAPKWEPALLANVTEEMTAAYFAPLGTDELALLTREMMQAARV
ncbi:MAG: enoyl-CoA hydratase/isomerase family protein [Hyphomicrobium sp.]